MLRVLLVLAAGYVGLCAVMFLLQRRLLYFPWADDPPRPTGPGWEGLEDVTLETSDGVELRGWYWPGERPLCVVAFHGNAGHRGTRAWWLQALRERLGVGVCMVDYRGYGGSGGTPTEEGLYRDAEATLDWLERRGAGPLVYWGTSLGSGVATEMALRRPPRALVLESPFRSGVAVASDLYPWLPVRLLMLDRFDNASKIAALDCPILIVHGERDRTIRADHGRALGELADPPAELWIVPGADHEDVAAVGGDAYFERAAAFLERLDGSDD